MRNSTSAALSRALAATEQHVAMSGRRPLVARARPRLVTVLALWTTLAVAVLPVLAGCVPLAVSGAAAGTVALADRRTLGAQTEDQSIELKAARELNQTFASGAAAVSVTSFNRRVLLTGQAATEAERKRAQQVVFSAAPNIRDLYDEIQVATIASLGADARAPALSARVKTELARERELASNAIKVISEGSVVYLMGLVTQSEGDRAAVIASRTPGATRIVTLFEYLTPPLSRSLR